MATTKARSSKKKKVAVETPVLPHPETGWGTVSPETLSAIQLMRNRSESIISEVGRMELRKHRFVDQIEELDQNAARLLRQEAKALGIPDEVRWRMTPDGKALPVEEGA
jgi:nucleoside-triphosphatase THEP1